MLWVAIGCDRRRNERPPPKAARSASEVSPRSARISELLAIVKVVDSLEPKIGSMVVEDR